jgi:uncharacterized protein (TIGR02145 family)
MSDYVGTFGYLYNWYAVNDSRKLCPKGWHVPTDAEWTIMIQTLDPSQAVNSGNVSTFTGIQSSTAGTVMKSTVTNTIADSGLGWNPGSLGTNTSGFTALPGGIRDNDPRLILYYGMFWSVSERVSDSAWARTMFSFNGRIDRNDYDLTSGLSVRCLKD